MEDNISDHLTFTSRREFVIFLFSGMISFPQYFGNIYVFQNRYTVKGYSKSSSKCLVIMVHTFSAPQELEFIKLKLVIELWASLLTSCASHVAEITYLTKILVLFQLSV